MGSGRQIIREMILREIRGRIAREIALSLIHDHGAQVLNDMVEAEVESLIYDKLFDYGALDDDWPDTVEDVFGSLAGAGVEPSGRGGIEGGE